MEVNISMYAALRDVAKRNRIKNKVWAAASGMKEPRISELNYILKVGPTPGRLCTIDKIIALHTGLIKLLGEGQVRQDLQALLEKETDVTKRLIIMCLMLGEAGEKYRDQAEMFLQTLLRSIANDK